MDGVLRTKGRKRSAARVTTLRNGWIVETWWDRHSRNWVTSVKDPQGYEMERLPSEFDGNKADARVAHRWQVERAIECAKGAGVW